LVDSGRPVVARCPINFCDFTCCDAGGGYVHLSSQRRNQCRAYRTGPVCANCMKGCTLSFDSPECVSINNCTTGHTMHLVSLTILYWMAVIALVFLLMYFNVKI